MSGLTDWRLVDQESRAARLAVGNLGGEALRKVPYVRYAFLLYDPFTWVHKRHDLMSVCLVNILYQAIGVVLECRGRR